MRLLSWLLILKFTFWWVTMYWSGYIIIDLQDNVGYSFLLKSFNHQVDLLSILNKIYLLNCSLHTASKFNKPSSRYFWKSLKSWIKKNLLTLPSLIMVLRECIISLIASATVIIQIHLLRVSSHTRSSSISSLIMILIAS